MASGDVDVLTVIHGQYQASVAVGFDVFDAIDVDDIAAVDAKELFRWQALFNLSQGAVDHGFVLAEMDLAVVALALEIAHLLDVDQPAAVVVFDEDFVINEPGWGGCC